jgi:hypothetical protein
VPPLWGVRLVTDIFWMRAVPRARTGPLGTMITPNSVITVSKNKYLLFISASLWHHKKVRSTKTYPMENANPIVMFIGLGPPAIFQYRINAPLCTRKGVNLAKATLPPG